MALAGAIRMLAAGQWPWASAGWPPAKIKANVNGSQSQDPNSKGVCVSVSFEDIIGILKKHSLILIMSDTLQSIQAH